MTAEPLRKPLVWVDLEMTGLDPDRDVILEAAALITDGALERVIEGPDLVLAAPEEALEGMAEVVAEMHATSGLTDAVRASTVRMDDAEEQLLAFVAEHVPEARTAPLAGNSVHADRAFLRRYMPAFESHLHYRNVDVSTLKELCKRWRPDILESSAPKAGGHRAMADIRESLEELRIYRDALFRAPAEADADDAAGDTATDGGAEAAGEGSPS